VLVVLPLFFIISQRIIGQVDSLGNNVFSGIIIDDSLGYALPSVHLWNESTRMGSISNDSGEFSIYVKNQDTVVFSIIGYISKIIVVSSSLNQSAVVRLKPKKYEIGEVTVRRFRSYASFKYQFTHLDLPESNIAQLRDHLKITSIDAALEADRERATKDKLGFGFMTPLGPGIDREKIFKEKISALEKRKRVIDTKFNRVLVGDITQLEGDELTEFIALCNFSEEYLYETDLYTIIEALYAKFKDYQNMIDTIPSVDKHDEFD
jgi:hypothetical protein